MMHRTTLEGEVVHVTQHGGAVATMTYLGGASPMPETICYSTELFGCPLKVGTKLRVTITAEYEVIE